MSDAQPDFDVIQRWMQSVIMHPDGVAEQLAVFGELGFTDVIIRIMPAPEEATVRSVELAGQVRARLQAARPSGA